MERRGVLKSTENAEETAKVRHAKPEAEDARPAAVGKLLTEAMWIGLSEILASYFCYNKPFVLYSWEICK
jgi:hypothetical protein